MSLWFFGCGNPVVGCGPKTRYALVEAVLYRVEHHAGEADRHVCKRFATR